MIAQGLPVAIAAEEDSLPPPESMLEAALWYAEHGFPVFPLHSTTRVRTSVIFIA